MFRKRRWWDRRIQIPPKQRRGRSRIVQRNVLGARADTCRQAALRKPSPVQVGQVVPTRLKRAERRGLRQRPASSVELSAKKRDIKHGVVRNQHAAPQQHDDLAHTVPKPGRLRNVLGSDPMHMRRSRPPFGIEPRRPLRQDLARWAYTDDPQLEDPLLTRAQSCRLKINNCEARGT